MHNDELTTLRQRIAELEALLQESGDAMSPTPGSTQTVAEQRLRAIFSSSVNFAIIATDRAGIITDWNRGASQIFGWSAEEIRGDAARRLFTPEDCAERRVEQEMSDALAHGRADDERWHLRKDGTRFWASGEMMPLRADDGAHLGFVKIVMDRTAEHRAGMALDAAEQSRRRTQHMQLALALLSERIRDLASPDDISFAAAEVLGTTLEVSLVGYGIVDSTAETVTIERHWVAGDAQKLHGPLQFRDYGSYIDDLRNGVTVVIDDVRLDSRTGAHAQALIDKHAASFVNVPIHERGTFVAMLFVLNAQPRDWRDDELMFIREVASRVRVAAERSRTERALRISEAQFGAFAQAMPNHVWAARANGDFYWFNEPALLYTGKTAGSLLGPAAWFDIIHPDDRQSARHAWQRSLEAGTPLQVECRVARFDGAYRWFLVRARRVMNTALEVEGWVGTNTDIHQQRQQSSDLERLVSERTEDRNALWQLSSDIMLRCTFEGRITAVNPAWEEVLGWTEGELLDSNLFDLIHPDDLVRTEQGARTLSEGGAHNRFDNRYRHRDGSYRWISWSTRPGGNLINAVGRDISSDMQQSTALRDSMDFTRLALSAVGGVGVWTYDVASDEFTCDRNISALYAIDADEGAAGIKRERFLANVHPDDRKTLAATMAGGLVNSGDLELEYRICHPDGSVRWVLSRGHTYFDGDKKPLRRTGVGVELTRQRHLEDQLRQSQKMEAVGQLTGGLAHDFNNLLMGITGSLDLLRLRMQQGDLKHTERYLSNALSAAKRAAALTHRLLAFSRRQTLDPKATDVNRLVSGMEELIRRTVGPGIVIEVAPTADLWTTRVDPNQLENALLNLCINARDAMPDGGRVRIETSNRCFDDEAARAQDVTPGEYVSLSVADTGVGMTPEVIAKAFEPFFTTKPLGAGTGLGLSMTYGFARQSGGQVRILSEPGQGVTVCIYLPRHVAAPVEEEPATMLDEVPKARTGETVLVVDDEPAVRMLVIEVLRELGYVALEAGDGAAGLAVLQSGVPIDLVVSDVGLPGGMNGRQMVDAARVNYPTLKALFITGYAENAVIRDGYLEPGMHVMTKPFALDHLAARIREVIEST
ncbi:PAS domain-containing protein [Caballeronia sp. LZ065]|uniref:PAS domain-containing protein n=1 Tax=Caballeronia sp. LZ065 TaxID=3038571 RepID=UPI0028631471|nr:PAS domain-containing protein [Caballeronia sp. LZ065]MDR5780839.1 PAS domain-containing protein [Caballeronia sp. LZ065]